MSFQKAYALGSHNGYRRTKQTANKYGTPGVNMSTVVNEGVKMCGKKVTTTFFTVLGLTVELSISISKSNGYLDTYSSVS